MSIQQEIVNTLVTRSQRPEHALLGCKGFFRFSKLDKDIKDLVIYLARSFFMPFRNLIYS